MSMDFSRYTVDGVIANTSTGFQPLNKNYFRIASMYNVWGEFNRPIPTDFAYSANQRYFAGRYITSISPKQLVKFDASDSLYNVEFTPYVTSSPLVYTSFGRTQYARTSFVFNGYDSPVRKMAEPTSMYDETCRTSYINFQSELEPRRIRVIIPWAVTIEKMAGTGNTLSRAYINQSTWNAADAQQWITTVSLTNILRQVSWAYYTKEQFATDTARQSDYAYSGSGGSGTTAFFTVFRTADDGHFFTGLSSAISQHSVTNGASFSFNKNTLELTKSAYDCFNTTTTSSTGGRAWVDATMYGQFPRFRLKYQDFVNHYNLIGSDTAYMKSLYYINNKWWHIVGTKFVDENGVEMPTDDVNLEMGAFRVVCTTDNTSTFACNVIPICHVSNVFQVVASAGVPFMMQASSFSWYEKGLFEEYAGDSVWYQAPVNKDGRVIEDYKPLSKDPKNFQGIIDPAIIVIAPAGEEPIDSTPLKVPPAYYIGAGTQVYALTQGQLESTMVNLFSLPTSIIETIDKFNNSLGESIKSILVYPFDISQLFKTAKGNMVFHGEQIISNIYHVLQSTTIFEMGTYTVPSTNTFLDYSPYCNYYLYLPYCGVIRLDSRDVVGKAISVKYVIDILTGSCTANIFREGVLIRSEPGTIGVHIPITSRDFTEMANTLLSAGVESANALMTAGMNMASMTTSSSASKTRGNVGGIAGSISSVLEVANNLDRLADSSVQQRGNPTTSGAFVLPQYPFIIRIKAKESTYKGYAHEKGVACLKTDNFHNFHGYTVFQNFDTSGIPLLEEELMELKRIMESGVYI